LLEKTSEELCDKISSWTSYEELSKVYYRECTKVYLMTKDLKSKLLKLLNCKQVGRDVDEGIFTLFALLTSEYSLSNTV